MKWQGVIGILASMATTWCRPVDLAPPATVFDGITEQGHFLLNQEVGAVDFGDNLSFPLRAVFSSNGDFDSPYCGSGWCLTVMESIAIPISPSVIKLRLPCGKIVYFRQSEAGDKSYVFGEWNAQSEGDVLTVSRDDGWKMTYRQGKLAELQSDKGKIFRWKYSQNQTDSIEEAASGKILLTVQKDSEDPARTIVETGRYKFAFRTQETPVLGKTLVEISGASLKPKTFQWAGDKSGSNLTWSDAFGNINHASWAPDGGQILSVNEWRYGVTPLKSEYDTVEISRTNPGGLSQYYYYDRKKGILTRKDGANGDRTYYFLAKGPLYGKIRLKEETRNGVTKTVYQSFYDQDGKLLRWSGSDGNLNVVNYDKQGRAISETKGKDGPVNWSKQYDEQGRLLEDVSSEGIKTETNFLDNGKVEVRMLLPGGETVATIKEGDKVVSRSVSGKLTETYNADGLVEKRTMADGSVYQFAYNEHRQIKEVTLNSVPVTRQYFDSQNKLALKIDFDSAGRISRGLDVGSDKVLSPSEIQQAIQKFN